MVEFSPLPMTVPQPMNLAFPETIPEDTTGMPNGGTKTVPLPSTVPLPDPEPHPTAVPEPLENVSTCKRNIVV